MAYTWTNIFLLLLIAATAMVASAWIYPKILHIARQLDFTDKPSVRKLQTEPTPVLGGLVVYFGLMTAMLVAAILFHEAKTLMPVIAASAILLLVGFADDVIDLKASIRLVIECLVMLGIIYGSGMSVDSLHGLWHVYDLPDYVAIPLTVFAGVGIINALNMVDGVNGLSSGLCITSSTLLAIILYKCANPMNAALAAGFAGALIPFFIHNLFGTKSRMFIGDSGTMVMGVLVSWFVIVCMNHEGHFESVTAIGIQMNMAAMLLAVVSVPVTDALRVMMQRIIQHKSPFKPDKTHLHHAFLQHGASHLKTTLSEILLNLAVVAIWYTSYKVGLGLDAQMYITIAACVILIAGTYILLVTTGKVKKTK